ncbi:FecR family protein [Mucilaginibacter sp. UR6-11]|uniref:FecR family protein n=1 Tax=Mucilaginibacter sp. UR6-11 TaxID=1435644 RepID=UPI001E4FABC3|nr:FecR family protein [Mucilaginibacter sp. UR6-11]MCC8426487.1 FecR domain-containing protein [Mucilaginibacter sp. UR6-11]
MKDIDKQYFRQMLIRYRKGIASVEEIKLLESFYDLFDVNDDLITDDNEEMFWDLQQRMKYNLNARITKETIRPNRFIYRRLLLRLSAAAALFLLIGGSIWVFRKPIDRAAFDLKAKNSIRPGGNRATLQLANGSKIDLSTANNGVIAKQAGIFIHKNAQGLIVYTLGANHKIHGLTGQNTISTPKGGQYQVVLPDGTQVTLNAASSITYPVVFNGGERLVRLTGEAYFEVAKDRLHPFKVNSGSQTVTVLGTHFNINAYDNEATVKTTLLEGLVDVTAGSAETKITPGQQTILNADGQLSKKSVDIDKEVAWKNGLFSFAGDDLKTIMRQVARWYDVDVSYNGNLPDEKFYGEITRSSRLADVLRIMELNNVHFDINGRHLTATYTSGK